MVNDDIMSLLFQVFSHVLRVCKHGLCSTDFIEDSKLETKISVLPLVSL